jgi:hypothetical protein
MADHRLQPMAQAPFQRTSGRHLEEHQLLVSAEKNDERRAFLELLWHVGAAQFDLVNLKAEDVDWNSRTISLQSPEDRTPLHVALWR